MTLCSDVAVVVPHCSYAQNISKIVSELVEHFEIVIVNDGSSFFAQDKVTVLKTDGLGFAGAVNVGLSYVQSKGKGWAFVLNDDAYISSEDLNTLVSKAIEPGLYAPTIVSEHKNCFGFRVSSWGRVIEIRDQGKTPNALCGAALLMPSWMRFDPLFIHGMEDVEMSLRLQEIGFKIHQHRNVFAFHKEGKTIPKHSYFAQKGASFGQMCLFPRHTFFVVSLCVLQVLKEGGDKSDRFLAIVEAFNMFRQR